MLTVSKRLNPEMKKPLGCLNIFKSLQVQLQRLNLNDENLMNGSYYRYFGDIVTIYDNAISNIRDAAQFNTAQSNLDLNK